MSDVKPVPVSEAQIEAELARMMGKRAAASPNLSRVPEKHRNFFAAMMGSKNQEPEVMDLSEGRARPEELKALKAGGWDGVSPLPANIAELKKLVPSKEDRLADLEDMESPSDKGVEITPFEKAPSDQQKAFVDMAKAWQNMTVPTPKIIDSRKPQPAPESAPAPKKDNPVARLLAPVQPPTPPPPAAESKAEPTKEVPAEPPLAPKLAACPRCSCDLSKEYKIQPTDDDLRMRIATIQASVMGGDGRFRKAYPIFNGAIVVTFRELKDEGHIIYNVEGDITLSNDPEKAVLQRMFSMDRISFRRHCCSIDRVTVGEKTIEVPQLSYWIDNCDGDTARALAELESFVRGKLYANESVLMASGQAWSDFEALINVMWANQSFYKGTP